MSSELLPNEEQSKQTILFENRYEATLRMLNSRGKFSLKNNVFRFLGRATLILYLVVGLIPVVYITFFNTTTRYILYIISFLFLIFLILSFDYVKLFIRIRNEKKISGGKIFFTNRFGDKNIEISDNKITSIFSYDLVNYIYENREYYYLWIEDSSFIVCKDSFTVGDKDGFGDFIRDKCSEKKPLLSSFQRNLKTLKMACILSVLIIFLAIGTLPDLWTSAFQHKATPHDQIIAYHGGDINIITTEELAGGAIVFVAQEPDVVGAYLFKKSDGRFLIVDGHTFSISNIAGWSKENDTLFESHGGLLMLNNEEWNIVYGVIEIQRWNDLPESKKISTKQLYFNTKRTILYYIIGI